MAQSTQNDSTVLIVDDQPGAREVLRGLLTGQGYDLAFASNGEEALAKAAELGPDLILLDVMMPGMDGFEVCRRLRADPLLAKVPIIMITALDDRDARLQGLKLGVDDFITKPFISAELQARVRTITRLNRQRRLHLLELQAERDRTQAILEALGEAVVVTDTEGIIQYLNPAAVALTGFSPEESLGRSWRPWLGEETEDSTYEDILATVYAGQTWQGEVMTQQKGGTFYDAALTVAPLFAPDCHNEPIGFVGVLRDITPLKETERAKNEFVSNVSHELRTPLSVLTLIGDNLDTLYERLEDDRRRKMIRDIQKHTQILNELIGDVLEISRIDSRRISMEREPLNLTQLVQTEIEEMQPLAQQKSQTLQISRRQQLDVLGNSDQLRQVIRNLVSNAIKYTPEGGQIRCEGAILSCPSLTDDQEREIWPGRTTLPGGFWAAWHVTDTGMGISEEHLPHLFDRFYRVKAQRNTRGTGLGLAITKKLIELHGGHIAVASTLDEGSTFAIYLPLLRNPLNKE
jgi:PAS domain S-box-containing protein